MAYYGNILILYHYSDTQLTDVENILMGCQADYERVEGTFFVETSSKNNTREVMRRLAALNLEYIFFHNHIANGSKVEAGGIAEDTLTRIEKILLE